MKKILFIFLLLNIGDLYSKVHLRPTPYLPTNIEPAKVADTVGFSILPLLHKSLFRLNSNGIPINQLIKNFNVSMNQKVYTFYLKNVQFHSGRPLLAKDVKFTLENAIINKSYEYEKLLNIVGSSEFQKNRDLGVSGISIYSDKKMIKIELRTPDPGFLYFLAEPSLSIVHSGSKGKDGLGSFEILEIKKSEITFKSILNKLNSPSIVKYKVMTKLEAITQFKNRKADDLALYTLGKRDLEEIRNISIVNKFLLPQTFSVFLNSRRLSNTERGNLKNKTIWSTLIDKCYNKKNKANSLIPKGFLGYLEFEKLKSESKTYLCLNRKVKIFVPRELGKEKCVIRHLKSQFKKCSDYSIHLVGFNEILSGWKDNSLDIYIGYIEAHFSAQFFGFFSSDAGFLLGVKGDKDINHLLKKIDNNEDALKKESLFKKIARYIERMNTVIPLYHGEMQLVTSDRYMPIKIGVMPSTYVSIDQYIYKD